MFSTWFIFNFSQNSVYTDKINATLHGRDIFVQRPILDAQSPFWYNPSDVANAWELFINASAKHKQLLNVETFRFMFLFAIIIF